MSGLRQKISLLLLTCFCCFTTVQSQDLVFSQYFNAPLLLNPAFAGVSPYPFFTLNYRNQWPSIDNAFVSYAASYNQYFSEAHSGVGVQLLSDRQADGILSFNSLGLSYSYALEFKNDNFLKMGLSTTFGQTSLDWDRLIFSDQLDIIEGYTPGNASAEIRPRNLTNGHIDVSAGFLFYNSRWFGGLGLFHLNKPGVGFNLSDKPITGLPLRISFHGGYQFVLWEDNDDISFIQPILLVTNQADFWQINAGFAAKFGIGVGGVTYRHTIDNPDAVIVYGGVSLDLFRITYSYDLTVSGLAGSTGGSHEIGVIFDLSSLYPPKSKLNDCLSLFR